MKCPHCGKYPISSLRKESYYFRRFYLCTWKQVANAVGYSNGNSARIGAKRYAEENNLQYPLPKSTKGACIYVSRRSGYTWHMIAKQYQQSILEVQRQAEKWAKRHNKNWPPS
tara:strand:+ start:407 stop:745 length:339 start_codon:yes stop_codon:yes gene_type:complete